MIIQGSHFFGIEDEGDNDDDAGDHEIDVSESNTNHEYP